MRKKMSWVFVAIVAVLLAVGGESRSGFAWSSQNNTLLLGTNTTEVIQPTGAWPGLILGHIQIPAGQRLRLDTVNYVLQACCAADEGGYVLHVFVTTTGPLGSPGANTISPWWVFAQPAGTSDGWRPRNEFPHLVLYGPAWVDIMVINATAHPQNLVWGFVWQVEFNDGTPL